MVEKLKVKNIIIGTQPETTENYTKFLRIVRKKNIRIIYVGATGSHPQQIAIEQHLYFDILWPNKSNLITENSLNNNSIVCKLNYKNFSMLFTGDIEEEAERGILQQYKNNLQIFNSDILKIAHHGSNTSSTLDFLEAANPKIALIGVGKDNKFGHPKEEVIRRLEETRYKNISHRPNGRNITCG